MKVVVLSEKQQEFNGVVYYLCGYYYQKKGKRLHRTVWECHNGEIPKGHHVHHVDGDRHNNQIENLELIKGKSHHVLHANSEEHIAYSKKQIEKIRPLASEWHKSEAGKQWHSEMAKEVWKNKEAKKYVCTQCNKEFESLNGYSKDSNTFCSNNCKSQYRRVMGYDDVIKTCAYCGSEFKANKYARSKCCSRECSVKMRWNK